MKSLRAQSGFSLVELSIVLVILGLLVGGVLAGQSLIRAAEIRSVGADFSRYQAAVMTFRDKYFALPGDMPNATAFWGAMAASPCIGVATGGTGTQTCDGNGNGQIQANGAVGTASEMELFWQHLANAGLIEGAYTGIRQAVAVPGVNAGRAKFSNGVWTTIFRGDVAVSNTQLIEGSYSNAMEPGTTALLSPEELWNIDTKLDDGRAGFGLVRAWEMGGVNCISVAASNSAPIAATATYNLQIRTVSCHPVFANAW